MERATNAESRGVVTYLKIKKKQRPTLQTPTRDVIGSVWEASAETNLIVIARGETRFPGNYIGSGGEKLLNEGSER